MSVRRLLLILSALVAASCGPSRPARESPPDGPAADEPNADPRRPRTEIVASLRSDLAAQRHPSDGGGRAWLVRGNASQATVRTAGRWTILYEAGELGIAEDGMVFLQVSPFWGWSTPQTEQPAAPGYTEVSTDAGGVTLEARTLDQQLLGIRIAGRPLEPGERLRIDYGAGSAGASADRFAEHDSRFWIAVDGDGDGVRGLLADSPGVDVAPGPPARLVVTLPSTARPGERARLTVAVLDGAGNAGVHFEGEIRFEGTLADVEIDSAALPEPMTLRAADLGRRTALWTVPREAGVVRLRAFGPAGLEASSNPLQVSDRGGRIFWGDLQNHSGYSDGTATPEEHFLYARDVAALDVYALTDHDHWGLRFLDQTPSMWDEIRQWNRRFYAPGRFVTFLGFEWTNWIHGHRHVIFSGDGGPLLSSIDEVYDEPQELWQALEAWQEASGEKAMTIAHHSAGGPIATDWSAAPPPELEPVTEIVSVHGSSEAADSPSLIHRPVAGNFVRDALARGYRLGFLGSSDGHDGHPGLAHLASPTGGLAAILADELTREAIWEALRSRHVYATSGPRIIVRTSFGGYRMGDEVPLRRGGDGLVSAPGGSVPGIPENTLVVQVVAPSDVERIDVVRSGRVESLLCGEGPRCAASLYFADPAPGEYLYLRIVQADGGLAWTSPFYFVE